MDGLINRLDLLSCDGITLLLDCAALHLDFLDVSEETVVWIKDLLASSSGDMQLLT